MEKEKLNELLHLYFTDELSELEKTNLLELVNSSEEVKTEFKSIEKLYTAFVGYKPTQFSESELIKSRQELIRNIRKEKLKPSFSDKFYETFDSIRMSGARLAFSGVFILLIGIFAGYLLFSPSLQNVVNNNSKDVVNIDQVLASGVDIDNVRLLDETTSEGKVTLTFQAAKPYSYTGEFEDKTVQRLLANLITKSDNPGMRIQIVNRLSDKMENDFVPDAGVKKALISSLMKDENVGVRRSALEVLTKHKYDEQIRDAFLFVLSNDQNSGMRIAAINALAQFKYVGVEFDNKVKQQLNKKVKEEQNLFIKNLAESLLNGENI